MKFIYFFIASVFLLFSCSDDIQTVQKKQLNDSIPGIFGFVKMYDMYGNSVPAIGVTVSPVVVSDILGNTINISLEEKETNENGFFEYIDCQSGIYNIKFSKENYESNLLVAVEHDDINADTLEIVKIAQVPPATIVINSIIFDSVKFSLNRTINFLGSTNDTFKIVSHYFVDTTELVSFNNYIAEFISGYTDNLISPTNTLNVEKTHNFINSKTTLKPGDKLFICAYPENFNYYSYSIPDANNKEKVKTYFPTLGEKSNVISYIIDSTMVTMY